MTSLLHTHPPPHHTRDPPVSRRLKSLSSIWNTDEKPAEAIATVVASAAFGSYIERLERGEVQSNNFSYALPQLFIDNDVKQVVRRGDCVEIIFWFMCTDSVPLYIYSPRGLEAPSRRGRDAAVRQHHLPRLRRPVQLTRLTEATMFVIHKTNDDSYARLLGGDWVFCESEKMATKFATEAGAQQVIVDRYWDVTEDEGNVLEVKGVVS